MNGSSSDPGQDCGFPVSREEGTHTFRILSADGNSSWFIFSRPMACHKSFLSHEAWEGGWGEKRE